MLELLMRQKGRPISTEQFMESIWGYDSEAEINVVWAYISYLRQEGMIFERKQLCQWNLPHLFAVGLRLAARLKQIVKPGQLYLTGAAFHDKTSCVNAV